MNNVIVLFLSLMMSTTLFAATKLKCGPKGQEVSCAGVKGAKRANVCVGAKAKKEVIAKKCSMTQAQAKAKKAKKAAKKQAKQTKQAKKATSMKKAAPVAAPVEEPKQDEINDVPMDDAPAAAEPTEEVTE